MPDIQTEEVEGIAARVGFEAGAEESTDGRQRHQGGEQRLYLVEGDGLAHDREITQVELGLEPRIARKIASFDSMSHRHQYTGQENCLKG